MICKECVGGYSNLGWYYLCVPTIPPLLNIKDVCRKLNFGYMSKIINKNIDISIYFYYR